MKDGNALVFMLVTATLSAILIGVVLAMLYGLFDQRVDNKEIFAILGPAPQTIVGAFVGILTGRALNRGKDGE